MGQTNLLNSDKVQIYAPKTEYLTEDVEKILSLRKPGLYALWLSGDSYSHNDIPSNSPYKYSFAIIMFRNTTSSSMMLFPEGDNPVAIKTRKRTAWGDWKYLSFM